MKKTINICFIICFLTIIYFLTFKTITTEHLTVSKLENRKLATIPDYSKKSLLNGEYFEEWESYFIDHFFGRDNWIKGYNLLNVSILGKVNVNNILITDEGYLLPFVAYDRRYNLKSYSEKIYMAVEEIHKLNDYIRSYGGKFYFIGIPEQSSYLRDRYPYYCRNKSEYLDNNENTMFRELNRKDIANINMHEIYRADRKEDYYFKTDHHFTFRGAYKAYIEIINKIIEDEKSDIIRSAVLEDEMEFVLLPNPILGSRNRKLSYIYKTDEKLEIGYPTEKISYEKFTNGQLDPDFYHIDEDIDKRPDYGVFMGGDNAETVIRTYRDELPNLLIFGDSFTNALEPLLYYHFDETRILDLRYYSKMSLYEYIAEHRPDYVLMIRDDLNYGIIDGNGKFD
ncbi:DHHW family protein [Tissierellaceae bacterium HCP3S3_D8]